VVPDSMLGKTMQLIFAKHFLYCMYSFGIFGSSSSLTAEFMVTLPMKYWLW